MNTPKSRPKRWQRAVDTAQEIIDRIEDDHSGLRDAMSELADLKSEYEDWRGNLPENLENSALASKLDAVIEMDFEVDDFEDIKTEIEDAAGADLPLGYGRD